MNPKPITREEVTKLIDTAMGEFPAANRAAIDNFCWNAAIDTNINKHNLQRDSIKFGWNTDTVNVICQVLIILKKM